MQLQPFDPAARTRLAELLDSRAEKGNTMRCDEVQAFMLALLSGPDALNTAEWLPEVLGDEALFSSAERAEVEALVLGMAADMLNTLSGKTLPELWLYADAAGNDDFFTWCNAYLYGLDTVPTDRFETIDDEAFEDLFYPVMALAGVYDEDEGGEAVLTFSAKELTQLEGELPHTLLAVYQYWQTIIHKPQTVRREGAKTGRNDECPCGSGKKYKACCGK